MTFMNDKNMVSVDLSLNVIKPAAKWFFVVRWKINILFVLHNARKSSEKNNSLDEGECYFVFSMLKNIGI